MTAALFLFQDIDLAGKLGVRMKGTGLGQNLADVYKRQELEQAVFLTLKKQLEAAAPLAPDGTLRVDASVPVSYTHLDVYKRQAT